MSAKLLNNELETMDRVGDWSPDEIFQDKVVVDNLTIFLSGVQASHPRLGTVTASAADIQESPIDRAWYELVERISILECLHQPKSGYPALSMREKKLGLTLAREDVFPTSPSEDYQFSKSNGVALHKTWEEASRRAIYELVERHLVLSSWAGIIRPIVTMEGSGRSPLHSIRHLYEVRRVNFGSQSVSCLDETLSITASAVALLPREKTLPLVLAFGAAETSRESLGKAEAEAIQRLGFLYGEEIPAEAPEFSPTNLYHQDYFLWSKQREKVEAWLGGMFFNPQKAEAYNTLDKKLAVSLIDLTAFPELNLKVAKAVCPAMIPLVFGRWRQREFESLPDSLLIHPIA